MRYQDQNLTEMLAAEYVLGTLKGRARQRFEGLLQAHPTLRKQVREWERRLNRLADSIPPTPPPPSVWPALEQRLFADSKPSPRFRRLGFWRNLTVGGGVLAGVLAVLLLVTPFRESPDYVMVLNEADNPDPVWTISASATMDKLYVKSLRPMNIPEGKGCLLWVMPKGSKKLYALGLLPDQGEEQVLKIGKDRRAMLSGQLLVSIEDSNAPLPTAPTGPPSFKGKWHPLAKL